MEGSQRDLIHAVRDEGDRIFGLVARNKTIGYLYARWLDERKYEDFADYEKEMRKIFPDLNIVKCHKRPFGFTVRLSDAVCMQIKITTTQISSLFFCEPVK